MTDHSVNPGRGRAGARRGGAEYRVYFALIFLIALPFAAVAWAFAALRHGHLPACNPVTRALREARAITPMIFLV
jgi:hypothetical protein